jgi:pilus assembly protein CpaF
MLQALNTGHDGSLSTVHANGPVDVLPRLETLVLMAGAGLPLLAVRSQIGAAIDAVVHVTRSELGLRRVEAIGELIARADALDVRPLFERRRGQLAPAGAPARPPRRTGTPPPDERWFAC